jgi:thymidylate synthase
MLPQIPIHLNIPNPVANGYVEQYLPYLMTDHIEPTEQYTYGSRIYPQIPYWIEVLKKTPNTNQAVLQVARHDDYQLEDPPCLRHIDMRIKNNTLIFYPYFRSWDLWGGFPANLAGIAVLQKSMADEIGVEAGPILASSKGLHIYGYVEELAKLRTGK